MSSTKEEERVAFAQRKFEILNSEKKNRIKRVLIVVFSSLQLPDKQQVLRIEKFWRVNASWENGIRGDKFPALSSPLHLHFSFFVIGEVFSRHGVLIVFPAASFSPSFFVTPEGLPSDHECDDFSSTFTLLLSPLRSFLSLSLHLYNAFFLDFTVILCFSS